MIDWRNAHNIMNSPVVREWYGFPDGADTIVKKQRFDRVMAMTKDNRSRLAEIYGPRHQTIVTHVRSDIWRIEFEGLYFLILSAKGKGTEIDIELFDDLDLYSESFEEKVIRFLDDLYDKLVN